MIDVIDVTADTTSVVLALGVAFFAIAIRNRFRGGLLWGPWRVIGPSPILFALGEMSRILEDVLGIPLLNLFHLIFEVGFLIMLLYGFYLFYKVWTPQERPKAS